MKKSKQHRRPVKSKKLPPELSKEESLRASYVVSPTVVMQRVNEELEGHLQTLALSGTAKSLLKAGRASAFFGKFAKDVELVDESKPRKLSIPELRALADRSAFDAMLAATEAIAKEVLPGVSVSAAPRTTEACSHVGIMIDGQCLNCGRKLLPPS